MLLCAGAWGDGVIVPESSPSRLPRIALIIDDLGNMLVNSERAAALDGPVACAVLPHTPYARRIAERAHAAGKEVMLHLPLEPVERFAPTSVGMIRIDTTRSQLSRILAIDLASVPHAVGLNNHQGSLLTRHPGHMNWLMAEISGRGDLFFVDSFTSESSVALRFAREHGVPSTRRDVFLDHTPTRAAIEEEFRRLQQIARSRGIAVGIGHPYTVTLDYLEQAIPALRAEGFELVPVSVAIALDVRPGIQTASLDTRTAVHAPAR
ncbi:MAG: divergent polysaccharide deacetylase family protein [Gammaproteobacteria bacterium]